MMYKALSLLLILSSAKAAFSQTPAFDPREWKGTQAGPTTKVLNLGSRHLSQVSVAGNKGMMAALLDKLAAFKPDIITVENVSGEQCEHLKRYTGVYPESFDTWCQNTEAAQKAVGLDTPAAAAEIRKTLASSWPAMPSPAARRRLAALFLAAGEKPSAVVQWQRLPPDERHKGDGINEETAKLLERVGARPDETYEVGVALAVRLGLERIILVDDHTSDGVVDASPGFDAAIQAAWKIAPSSTAAQENAMSADLKTPIDVLELYRFMNLPETQRQTIKADFHAALSQQTPELYGRQYVAAWEVRNLRMVSNIRAAFGARPGARVLNIVGASHKPYYDAYLQLMHEIELVDVETVLK